MEEIRGREDEKWRLEDIKAKEIRELKERLKRKRSRTALKPSET
jgi:hypothetical protein